MSQTFCTQCGSKLPEVGNFCPECGAPVESPVRAASAPTPSDPPAAVDSVSQLDAELAA